MTSLLIKNGTIVRTDGMEEGDILIESNVITSIGSSTNNELRITNYETIDATNLLIFPGFIDCHVHFREPGYEYKATMQSEADAAQAGGVTTVCEMPNTDPPTNSYDAFVDKVDRAEKVKNCDIYFFFLVTEEAHTEELKRIWEDPALRTRCSGVKLYFDHSTGNQKAEDTVIEAAFKTCGELKIPLVGHCEDPEVNAEAEKSIRSSGSRTAASDVSLHSQIRPPQSEIVSIKKAITLSEKYGTAFHVAHMSTGGSVDLVRDAKARGAPITCEVAPHHLLLTTDHYDHFGTLVKMNPPLRTQEHIDALWEGIADGTVDCIATDHAPHTLEEKQSGPTLDAPSGVPGVETMIPLLLTIAAESDTLTYSDILRLCFGQPNAIYNLRKQTVEEGKSPDIVLVDPKTQWEIRGENLHGKSKWTPFEGTKVTGSVVQVIRSTSSPSA